MSAVISNIKNIKSNETNLTKTNENEETEMGRKTNVGRFQATN